MYSFLVLFSISLSPYMTGIRLDCNLMMKRFSEECGEENVAPYKKRCDFLRHENDYRKLYYTVQNRFVDCYIQ